MVLSKHASQAIKFLVFSCFILVICIFSLELRDAKTQINMEIKKYDELGEELILIEDKHKKEIDELNNEIITLNNNLNIVNNTISDLKSDEYELVYIGDYKLTHYCNEPYAHICGYGKRTTATGTKTEVGRTVAVDPKVIPYGTQMYIEGYGWRIAEDCGGSVKGNHIDVLVDYHDEALKMGVPTKGVWALVHKNPLTTQN